MAAGRPMDELTLTTALIAKLYITTSIGAALYKDLVRVKLKLDLIYATIPDLTSYNLYPNLCKTF